MQGPTGFLAAFATVRILLATIGLFTIPVVLGFLSIRDHNDGRNSLALGALLYGLPVRSRRLLRKYMYTNSSYVGSLFVHDQRHRWTHNTQKHQPSSAKHVCQELCNSRAV
jgi:hypothetical protein